MRILAEFIMRGRMQAIIVVALATAVPMMFGLARCCKFSVIKAWS